MPVTMNQLLETRKKIEDQLLKALQDFEGATLCSVREIRLDKMSSAKGIDMTAKVTMRLDLPDRPRKELEA